MQDRFAPSPTGYLHLGHAFSALTAWDAVQSLGGTFLLRMEDIDSTRSRPEFVHAIYDDLHWLGLKWPEPVLYQSTRMAAYETAIAQLAHLGLCYPCSCTRRDITTALSAPQEQSAQVSGPDGLIYPGTCRARTMQERGPQDAVRLNMAAAAAFLGGGAAIAELGWTDIGGIAPQENSLDAQSLIDGCGDIVLARRDIRTSYHLSVVVDDAAQAITHVTRGADMIDATQIHRLLQALLALPVPIYRHHRLIRDAAGKRLAKRDDARAIRRYRADGASPEDIRSMVGL